MARVKKDSAGTGHQTFYRRRGNALVELIICMPMILMLVMGASEYGQYFFMKSVFQNAAMIGAKAAVSATATDAGVASAVGQEMSNAGFSTSQYTVTTSPASVNGLYTGAPIAVTVSGSWDSLGVHPLPKYLGGIPAGKTISGVVTMNRE